MTGRNLTDSYYYGADKILIAIDCIIFGFDGNHLKLLLFKRKVEPYAGQWSLIGSFVMERESLDEAANRILFEISGLEHVYLRQLHGFGAIDRDPGARVISIAYFALIRLENFDTEKVRNNGAHWFNLGSLPELILDHREMVGMAHIQLKRQARFQPIGLELLPPRFTLPQLLKLYEEVYQKELDDRNFRKKIRSLNLLIRLDEKDKSSSKKGAYLYRFDRERYNELVEKGIDISF